MKYVNDYGMVVNVKTEKDLFLFLDGIDRDRYISLLIKRTEELFKDEIYPLIAGLNAGNAVIVFDGGSEEKLRYIMRKVHIAYSAYRRNKKYPVRFKKSSFEIIDGVSALKETVNGVKERYDFLCTKFWGVKVNRKI